MKKKDKTIFNFILSKVGIEISPLLEHLILNPRKIGTLNNIALEQVVKEFAPIHQKFRHTLDGPKEASRITCFEIFLLDRLTNKPELEQMLEGKIVHQDENQLIFNSDLTLVELC